MILAVIHSILGRAFAGVGLLYHSTVYVEIKYS